MQWFTRRRDFTDYIMTARKELLAGADAILIDDRLENVEEFRKAGGEAVLFPSRWQGRTEDEVWEALLIVLTHVERLVNSGQGEVEAE